MIFNGTKLAGAFQIEIEKHVDERGFNARAWCATEFAGLGITTTFVQANIAVSDGHNEVIVTQSQTGGFEITTRRMPHSQSLTQETSVRNVANNACA